MAARMRAGSCGTCPTATLFHTWSWPPRWRCALAPPLAWRCEHPLGPCRPQDCAHTPSTGGTCNAPSVHWHVRRTPAWLRLLPRMPPAPQPVAAGCFPARQPDRHARLCLQVRPLGAQGHVARQSRRLDPAQEPPRAAHGALRPLVEPASGRWRLTAGRAAWSRARRPAAHAQRWLLPAPSQPHSAPPPLPAHCGDSLAPFSLPQSLPPAPRLSVAPHAPRPACTQAFRRAACAPSRLQGPFEANDIYALVNALPAMGLCLYGFLRPDVWGGVCFGAGLGITLFGISYM